MQIYLHSHLCSYLPRVPILEKGTIYMYIYIYIYIYIYKYITISTTASYPINATSFDDMNR